MSFHGYVVFVLIITLISVMTYWLANWLIHRRKYLPTDYSGGKGFLKWGYRLRWNMSLVAITSIVMHVIFAPTFH